MVFFLRGPILRLLLLIQFFKKRGVIPTSAQKGITCSLFFDHFHPMISWVKAKTFFFWSGLSFIFTEEEELPRSFSSNSATCSTSSLVSFSELSLLLLFCSNGSTTCALGFTKYCSGGMSRVTRGVAVHHQDTIISF